MRDLDARLPFWTWLLEETLGPTPFQNWSGGRSWRLGSCYIVLSEGDNDALPDHLAFEVSSRATLDAVWDVAARAGGARLYEDEHPFAGGPDHLAAYVADPMQFKFEMA